MAPLVRQDTVMRIGDLEFGVLSSTEGVEQETGDPPVYVLVHGIGMSHRYLERLHRELSASRHVHSIDLPGFGGMRKPRRSLTVATMAEGLGAALDRLGVEAAILVGHSMGAQWVVELAAQRPDLVTGVVVIGPVADDEHRTLRAQSLALGIDSMMEPSCGNALVFTDYLRCGPRWYLDQVGHMVSYRIEERVGLVRAPLLIVRGGLDPIARLEWCRRLRDQARDGSVVVVPGKRHLVHYSAPKAVASAIRAWSCASRASMRKPERTDRATR